MPKIKVKNKNIPNTTRTRICHTKDSCKQCPLIGVQIPYCNTRDMMDTSGEDIIELTEQEFPTNREWMESLLNEELAALLTTGLLIIGGKYDGLKATSSLIIDKESMLDWLSQPCAYLMEE